MGGHVTVVDEATAADMVLVLPNKQYHGLGDERQEHIKQIASAHGGCVIVSIGVEDDDLCVIRSRDSVVYFLTSLPVHVFRTGYSRTGHFSWSQPSRFLDRRLRALSSLYPVCSDC